MAGLRGNVAWQMAQKQATKGTAATWSATKAHKTALTGGWVSPARETDNLSETDASQIGRAHV